MTERWNGVTGIAAGEPRRASPIFRRVRANEEQSASHSHGFQWWLSDGETKNSLQNVLLAASPHGCALPAAAGRIAQCASLDNAADSGVRQEKIAGDGRSSRTFSSSHPEQGGREIHCRDFGSRRSLPLCFWCNAWCPPQTPPA